MKVAILAFDGFDELGTFIALGLINRLRADGWSAEIAAPSAQVTSTSGVTVTAQRPLEFANRADAVIFAGGLYARAIAENGALLDRLQIDPVRQVVCGQDSGVLLMARLGLLGTMPACADAATKPFLVEAGVMVLDEPFHARGPVATAGGAMSAAYLAAWILTGKGGTAAAQQALQQTAPAGKKPAYVEQVMGVVGPFVP